MKKAIVTIGISASGKSTLACEWVADGYADSYYTRVEINRDTFRKQLMEADGRSFSWDKWKWSREKEVDVLVSQAVEQAVATGKDIICSDTNLNEGRRTALIKKLEGLGFEVEIKEFPVTLEEAWRRDAARENGVGHSVIAEQYQKWLAYKGRKTYVADISKPKCIIVDIDGTLSHMNGKRGAFDWDKVAMDDLDEQVKFIVHSANITGIHVILLSGRDGCCRKETMYWLTKHGVIYDALIMRTSGDMRDDREVKEQIFWEHIADNYSVQFVVDDRPKVVRRWQEIGLKTFCVGNPWIEF